MPVAVQGKLVAAFMNMLNQIGMMFDAFSHHVKCGAYRMSSQNLKQTRRIQGVRTIVKGQSDLISRSIAVIEDFWMAALGSLVETVQEWG